MEQCNACTLFPCLTAKSSEPFYALFDLPERQLAAQHLGREIQRLDQRHDPEEDATALMQLYLEKVQPQLIEDYSLLVDWYTRKTIEQVAAWQQQQHAGAQARD